MNFSLVRVACVVGCIGVRSFGKESDMNPLLMDIAPKSWGDSLARRTSSLRSVSFLQSAVVTQSSNALFTGPGTKNLKKKRLGEGDKFSWYCRYLISTLLHIRKLVSWLHKKQFSHVLVYFYVTSLYFKLVELRETSYTAQFVLVSVTFSWWYTCVFK